MKKCPKCNREIGDVKYCSYCGAKIDTLNVIFSKSNSLLKQNVRLDDVDLYETKNDIKNDIDNSKCADQQSIREASLEFEKAPEIPAPVIEDDEIENENLETSETDDTDSQNGKTQEDQPIETPSLAETTEKAFDENNSDQHENESIIADDESENTKTDIETNDEIIDEETSDEAVDEETNDEIIDEETNNEIVNKEAEDQDTENRETEDQETENQGTEDQDKPFELSSLFAVQDHATDVEDSDDDNEENEISSETVIDIIEKAEDISKTESQDIAADDDDNSDREESSYSVAEPYDDGKKQETPAVMPDAPTVKETADDSEKNEVAKNISTEKSISAENSIPISDIDHMFGDAPTFDIESIKKSYLNAQKEKEFNKTQKKKKSFFKNKRQ